LSSYYDADRVSSTALEKPGSKLRAMKLVMKTISKASPPKRFNRGSSSNIPGSPPSTRNDGRR